MAAVVFSTDTDDDGTGTVGTIRNNAWKQAMATAINGVIGDWVAVSFSAGNFTASAGSWTVTSGQVLYNEAVYLNHLLLWHFKLSASAVTSTPASLRIASPAGVALSSPYTEQRCAFAADNGVYAECLVRPLSSFVVELVRADGGNFHTSASTTAFSFSAWFQVN